MVDIIIMEETDQVAMSIEFASNVLDRGSAKSLVREWALLVKNTLKEDC